MYPPKLHALLDDVAEIAKHTWDSIWKNLGDTFPEFRTRLKKIAGVSPFLPIANTGSREGQHKIRLELLPASQHGISHHVG